MKKMLLLFLIIFVISRALSMETNVVKIGDKEEDEDIFFGLEDICQLEDIYQSDELLDDTANTLGCSDEFMLTKEESAVVGKLLQDGTLTATRNFSSFLACSLCTKEKVYKNEASLRRHEASVHHKKTYMCMSLIQEKSMPNSICLETFRTKQELDNHRKSHNLLFCCVCGKKFSKHITNGKKFSWQGTLAMHYMQYHPRQNNFCLLCEPMVSFNNDLQVYCHLKNNHGLFR